MKRWAIALLVLLFGRRRRRPKLPKGNPTVEPGPPDRGAETMVLVLFGCAAFSGIAFPVVYAVDAIPHQTQFLGLALGLALGFIAAACVVIAKRLVVTEELEEDYPLPSRPEEEESVARIVDESGSRFTRKRLLLVAGARARNPLGAAPVAPSPSPRPPVRASSLYPTAWLP